MVIKQAVIDQMLEDINQLSTEIVPLYHDEIIEQVNKYAESMDEEQSVIWVHENGIFGELLCRVSFDIENEEITKINCDFTECTL